MIVRSIHRSDGNIAYRDGFTASNPDKVCIGRLHGYLKSACAEYGQVIILRHRHPILVIADGGVFNINRFLCSCDHDGLYRPEPEVNRYLVGSGLGMHPVCRQEATDQKYGC